VVSREEGGESSGRSRWRWRLRREREEEEKGGKHKVFDFDTLSFHINKGKTAAALFLIPRASAPPRALLLLCHSLLRVSRRSRLQRARSQVRERKRERQKQVSAEAGRRKRENRVVDWSNFEKRGFAMVSARFFHLSLSPSLAL
jgi:hypothetical protein